jgi:ketol-acid reductoisomerase
MGEHATAKPTLYGDDDADLGALAGERIAVIGYGNQGSAQALNLRDSGLDVRIGAIRDATRDRALADGFTVADPAEAATEADVVMLLIPDEVMAEVFERDIRPGLRAGDCLDFASGYNVAFGQIVPPPDVDVVMVAPRMIGVGVRDTYRDGRGFPSFVGVHQDATGRARARMLALAKGLGSTRAGCLDLSFADEAALDLFTEQGFGPAFGMALMGAVQLLVEKGFPPEAVLLELLHSGELAYTLGRMASDGIVEQMDYHSHTSQYGSMTRGARFLDLGAQVRARMEAILEEIRSGAFAEEWTAEQKRGLPVFEKLRAARQQHPIRAWDQRAREAFRARPAKPSAHGKRPRSGRAQRGGAERSS